MRTAKPLEKHDNYFPKFVHTWFPQNAEFTLKKKKVPVISGTTKLGRGFGQCNNKTSVVETTNNPTRQSDLEE